MGGSKEEEERMREREMRLVDTLDGESSDVLEVCVSGVE